MSHASYVKYNSSNDPELSNQSDDDSDIEDFIKQRIVYHTLDASIERFNKLPENVKRFYQETNVSDILRLLRLEIFCRKVANHDSCEQTFYYDMLWREVSKIKFPIIEQKREKCSFEDRYGYLSNYSINNIIQHIIDHLNIIYNKTSIYKTKTIIKTKRILTYLLPFVEGRESSSCMHKKIALLDVENEKRYVPPGARRTTGYDSQRIQTHPVYRK